SLFYLAIARLPLATVGAIEFMGTVILAAAGARTRRNVLALVLAAGGVAVLSSVQLTGQPLGLVFAFANCAGFMIYIMLGHHIANTTAGGGDSSGLPLSRIHQLGPSLLLPSRPAPRRPRPARPVHAHRRRRANPARPRPGRPGVYPPHVAALGHRRRRMLLRHPLRHRPARDGPAAPRPLLPHARPAARHSN